MVFCFSPESVIAVGSRGRADSPGEPWVGCRVIVSQETTSVQSRKNISLILAKLCSGFHYIQSKIAFNKENTTSKSKQCAE